MARIAKIMVKQWPEQHQLTVRRTIDFFREYADFMDNAVKDIMSLLEETGKFPASGPIVCFHNVELTALDVEIGFRVAEPLPGRDAVRTQTVPPQTVAVTIDRGPYEEQDPTMEALMEWLPRHGYAAAGGICYHYLNDEEQPTSEYLTEMFIPVRKKSAEK